MTNFEKTDQIVNLLLTERKRELSKNEQAILNEWLQKDKGNPTLYKSLKNDANIPVKFKILSEFDKDKAFTNFKQIADRKKKLSIYAYKKILRYAALLIPFAFAFWFIYQEIPSLITPQKSVNTEIHPGTSKAILKLADGTSINLDEEKNFNATYNGTTISNKQKEIVYKSAKKPSHSLKIEYNTIEIPRGGEYQLTLSDGTKVWLNSETVIKYPVAFSSVKREVQLTGEAYFEVTENKASPFIVTTAKMKVNVFGTSFNVRAYNNENITTTLVSGSVSINQTANLKEYKLQPNEQAIVSDQKTTIKNVIVDQYIAWKDGRILFEENTLEEIFSNLSRWYNIDVVYTNTEIKKLRFSIDLKRYDDFNEILEILELTKKVKFEIQNNTLLIMKN
ncbi:MAG: hypothetical protein COC06_09655 [Bacteroidales bacterium]|nr:MAG: hypothetical protein COC06_09655 [Bacteroidales bacterium]